MNVFNILPVNRKIMDNLENFIDEFSKVLKMAKPNLYG